MAEQAPTPSGNGVPPAGEQVHLPGASYLPAWTAFGITLALVGVILTWVITGIGVAIAAAAVYRWIRETREDMARLPLQH
jgi:uncharacterized membrane protein (DUF485 family)